MNTTADRLDAHERFLDTAMFVNTEAARLIATVQDALEPACAQTEWQAFLSMLRVHQPMIRNAMKRLGELPPPGADDKRLDLSDLLLERDVQASSVQCIEHAARTMRRAYSIVHLLHDLPQPPVDTNHHIECGDFAVGMYRSARMVLWHVASGKISADAPCLSFAVKLAVDEARDAYAHYACAGELAKREK